MWDRWVVGWGRVRTDMRVGTHVCRHVHTSAIGEVLSAQPWWADVMPGSGPCLRAALAVVGAARKSVVI